MTTTQSPVEIASLLTKQDLTYTEFAQLLAYVPQEGLPALFGQILFEICVTPNALAVVEL